MHEEITEFTARMREGMKVSDPTVRMFTELKEKPHNQGYVVCACAVGAAVLGGNPELANADFLKNVMGSDLYAQSTINEIVNRYELNTTTPIELPENLSKDIRDRCIAAFRALQNRYVNNRIGIASVCYYLNDDYFAGSATDPRELIAQFFDILNEHTELIVHVTEELPF